MKYIKKFESQTGVDRNYIEQCFIEMLETDDAEIDDENELLDTYDGNTAIVFQLNVASDILDGSIESCIQYTDRLKKLYQDIKHCIDKVKTEYPDLEYDMEESEYEIVLII